MELTQLKQFQAVARSENITTAGKQIFVSQPSLTRAVSKLEAELETPLFDRTERKLKLNRAGRTVLAYTNLILKAEEDFLNSMKSRTVQDSIRICTASMDLLSYLMPKLQAGFPQASLLYELGENVNFKYHLLHHKTDLSISSLPVEHPSLCNEFLFSEKISVSVPLSNPISEKESLTLEDLRGQSFAHYSADNSATHLIRHLMQEGHVLTITLPSVVACSLLLNTDEKYLLALPSTSGSYIASKPGRKVIPLACTEGFESAYYAAFRKEDEKRIRPLLNELKTLL